MINRTPKGVPLAIDPHKDLVQMPASVRVRAHPINPVSADFSGEQWAKSVPPVPHWLKADVDAALMKLILDVSERKRKSNVHHDSQANDLCAAVKKFERVAFCHGWTR